MSNKKENGYCTFDDLTFEDRVAQLQSEANQENYNKERSQMKQLRCDLMRATTPDGSRYDAIASFSATAMSTRYPLVVITAIMYTEALVIRDNITDISLVSDALSVYRNALMNPACNRDVVDVARDSTNNILNNTAERDLPKVRMSLQDVQNLLDQPELRFNNNRQISVSEIPAGSINCAQTKYGVIDPEKEERTEERAEERTEEIPGHVLFRFPNGEHVVVSKNDLLEHLGEDGNFPQSSIKENLTIRAKNNTQENNKDNKLTTAILNTLGDNRWPE